MSEFQARNLLWLSPTLLQSRPELHEAFSTRGFVVQDLPADSLLAAERHPRTPELAWILLAAAPSLAMTQAVLTKLLQTTAPYVVPILVLGTEHAAERAALLAAGADDVLDAAASAAVIFARSQTLRRRAANLSPIAETAPPAGPKLPSTNLTHRAQRDRPAQILVMHEDHATRQTLVEAAQQAGHLVGLLPATHVALQHLEHVRPDLVFLSYAAAHNTDNLPARLAAWEMPPILLVADETPTAERRLSVYEQQLDDYLPLPCQAEEFNARLALLLRQRDQRIQHDSSARLGALTPFSDPVTGLCDRDFFTRALSYELLRSRRYGYALSIALVQISRKITSQALDHPSDDLLLRRMARAFAAGLRGTDLIARLEGLTLGVLLAQTDAPQGLVVLNRLRERMGHPSASSMPLQDSSALAFHFGLACSPEDARDAVTLLKAAQHALQQAQREAHGAIIRWTALPKV